MCFHYHIALFLITYQLFKLGLILGDKPYINAFTYALSRTEARLISISFQDIRNMV